MFIKSVPRIYFYFVAQNNLFLVHDISPVSLIAFYYYSHYELNYLPTLSNCAKLSESSSSAAPILNIKRERSCRPAPEAGIA